jgi:CGNR zinc finger/Putative stress-induced transcription regulator
VSSHLVAGVPLPDAVGGHAALDFCNTRAGWGADRPKEYLTSPLALALWALDAGLSPPGTTPDALATDVRQRPGEGAAALRRALDLREALYRCALGHGGSADWRTVSGEAVAARAASTLTPGPDGARWVLAAGTLLPAAGTLLPVAGTLLPVAGAAPGGAGAALLALHAAAACAEDLLTSPLAGCVAACPGTGCGWLFGDRRRRRRWCSMAVCGNRAKARRHASRPTSTRE